MSEQKQAKLAAHIRAIVDQAPPLTDWQRDRLATILNPGKTTAPPASRAMGRQGGSADQPPKLTPRGPAIPPARADLAHKRPAVVYFLKAGEMIKIGTTRDLHTRIGAIRNGSPEPVTLLAAMPGSKEKEKEFHQRFSHLRSHGEWFRAGDDLMDFITSLSKGHPGGSPPA